MITEEEILALGFEHVEDWSSDTITTYRYIEVRTDKPANTNNIYRLERTTGTDYFELVTNLERQSDFEMWTRGFNGDLTDIDELSDIFEWFKTENEKI